MPFRLLLILMFLFTMPATGAYRWTAPDGTVIFSDNPPHPDAEKIELPLTSTIPAQPLPKTTPQKASKTAPPPNATFYTRLLIAQPENDQTIYENSGDINIDITINPTLNKRRGHKIVIELDGVAVVTTTSTQAVLPNVDRGTHMLRARIIDAEGRTVIAHEIQFHLRRRSILQ